MAFKSFDSRREHFEPYGLSCERWIPRVMPRTDRHNEIELNFLMSGSITYYFGDKVVTVPARKISVFWGLIPHKIIAHETKDYYYVCTVPLSMFLKWGMSDGMVNKIFTGELLVDSSESAYDQHLFSIWEKDITENPCHLASILEIKARLLRFDMAYVTLSGVGMSSSPIAMKIEKMVLHIARNYTENLTAKEISATAGINPDYANVLFKKTFGHSLMKQVMIERITHAQRELLFSDKPISHIALDCGFNSISCFNSAFRQFNNCSPREYKSAYSK